MAPHLASLFLFHSSRRVAGLLSELAFINEASDGGSEDACEAAAGSPLGANKAAAEEAYDDEVDSPSRSAAVARLAGEARALSPEISELCKRRGFKSSLPLRCRRSSERI